MGLGFHTDMASDKDESMSIDRSAQKCLNASESGLDADPDMPLGANFRESNLSGKNTAATISDPAQFGFCAENLKIENNKIKITEEVKMEEKNQVFSGKPSEKDIEAQIESML